MADKKIIKIFKRFLIKNHALDKYCKNVVFYQHRLYLSVLETLIHTSDSSFISSTFQWDNTDEGYLYWSLLASDWQYFLRKRQNDKDTDHKSI